jgi:hypothetical protein
MRPKPKNDYGFLSVIWELAGRDLTKVKEIKQKTIGETFYFLHWLIEKTHAESH